jgi:fluoride exporter
MSEMLGYFTWLHFLWLGLGGGFGAALRYSVAQVLVPYSERWPYATLTVNLSGALLLGFIAAFFNHLAFSPGFFFWELGVLGGYTTLSTYSMEVVRLFQQGRFVRATSYALASLILSIAALTLGFQLGGLLS